MTVKVLLIINRLEDNGGAEVSTGLLLDGLQGNGFDFTVVTLFGPTMSSLRSELESRGARFVEAPSKRRARLRAVKTIIEEWQPDVIHSTLFESDVIAALAGSLSAIPTLTSVVNTAYGAAAADVARSRFKLRVASLLVAQIQRFGFSHCHAITRASADSIRSNTARRRRTTVIPRGRRQVDAAEKRTDVRRVVLGECCIANDAFVILNVARHEHQKGHELLLASFAEFQSMTPNAALLIAGRQGHTTAAMTAEVERLGLHDAVHLLGVRADIDSLHAAADVFAFSSRWEGLGGSVLEAMAAGTPIVAFAIPAISEVCGDTARLVTPFDTGAFARELGWVHDHPTDAAASAERARERFASHYELESVNARMADLYRSVAGLPPPPLSWLLSPRRTWAARHA
jgi:glycosyltransferase involved in cell wall biosynthesis